MRQGVARRAGSFSRLFPHINQQTYQHQKSPSLQLHSKGRTKGLHSPTLNKILKILAPPNLRLAIPRRLILQLRQRLSHNVLDDIDQARSWLHFGAVGGEGETVLGYFEESNAEGPDVGGDGVGLAGDSLRSHVVGGADEGVSVAAGAEFAGDAEVAQFDGAGAGEEDVGGFDVWGVGVSFGIIGRDLVG